MTSSTNTKKIFPCLLFLFAFVFSQYFVFVTHGPVVSYLKGKISDLSFPLRLSDISRNASVPIHLLVLSYARTGSSFLGDLLNSYPKTFYYFEPLHFLSNSVLNSSHSEARQLLNKLFQCQVTQLPGFLSWQKNHKTYMKLKRNMRFWKPCSAQNSCYNATYIDNFCSHYHVIVVKTIRLSLREAAKIFQEYPHLNLKIIYLARDPRGTLNSRTQNVVKGWCKKDQACINPRNFCYLLEDDSSVACDLLSKRSNDFMILRYEDLSREPFTVTRRLAKWLGLSSTKEMEDFLHSHTATTVSPHKAVDGVDFPYSTFRNSLITATKWRQELSFVKAVRIQRQCHRAIEWLGYHEFETSGVMRSNVNFDKDIDQNLLSFCS